MLYCTHVMYLPCCTYCTVLTVLYILYCSVLIVQYLYCTVLTVQYLGFPSSLTFDIEI